MVVLIKMEVASSNCSWSFMASRAGGREVRGAASLATMSSMRGPPSPGGGGECITTREGPDVAGEHAELERPSAPEEGGHRRHRIGRRGGQSRGLCARRRC